MARQNQVSEQNTFVGGFITEASPLTFPQKAAVDISNFNINKTGEVSRRLGMDFEEGFQYVPIAATPDELQNFFAAGTFQWENPGGFSDKRLVVVQMGSKLVFHDATSSPISGASIYTHSLESGSSTYCDMAVVDGLLVVVSGYPRILTFNYDGTNVSVESSYRLKTRDVFGVSHIQDGVNYRLPENIDKRPTGTLFPTSAHDYNLRNGSWATLRFDGNRESVNDPVKAFYNMSIDPEYNSLFNGVATLPSYADNVNLGLLPDANDGDNRLVERFFPEVMVSAIQGKFPAPIGHFTIDLLDRGASRNQNMFDLFDSDDFGNYSSNYNSGDIPADRTPGGSTCVAEFAGRAWYAGFSGEVIGGDEFSPRLSSYVMFSKLVQSAPDLGVCMQVGDPTSRDASDLLDTDGGFIRIDGAYNILRMVNIGSSLMIVAENGVWAVLGGSEYGFTATDSKVVKVTDKGCVSKRSVVEVDGQLSYWGGDGIYIISTNELGQPVAQNITNNTIQTFYEGIPTSFKRQCQGYYDSYERKVRWVFGNSVLGEEDSQELVFDLSLGAFYKNLLAGVASGKPNVICPFEVPPFRTGLEDLNVIVGSDEVLSGSDDVVTSTTVARGGTREIYYLSVNPVGNLISYSFSLYKDNNFKDWFSYDGVGSDSEAYLVTGWDGGGDYQRNKQVPYITFHLRRTENGFYEDELGDIYPLNESSCLVQAQWDWTNSVNSNRWGRQFQAYRYKRLYMPTGSEDSYDNGHLTITTKNKLRGKGRVLSLKIQTEPNKDLQLLGWSMLTGVATNV